MPGLPTCWATRSPPSWSSWTRCRRWSAAGCAGRSSSEWARSSSRRFRPEAAPGYRAGIRPRLLILLLSALAVAVLMSGGAAAQSFGHGLQSLPATAPVQLTLSLQPRHPRLLERLALASGGRRPLPPRLVRALFLPSPRDIARVQAVMAASGLRLRSRRGLSMSFTGPAAAAEQAFGVSLHSAAGGVA